MREAGWVRCPGCGRRVAVPVCPAGGGIANIHECSVHVLSLHRRPTGEYVVVAYRNHRGFAVGPGEHLEMVLEGEA